MNRFSHPLFGFCRDCLHWQTAQRIRCESCGSPRILHHAELYTLSLAHIDCDAFYASVEKRDHPELRDKPLIIGGGKRGVVSTACYIARISGVRSAMPMYKALELCPEAIVLRPDMQKYARVSGDIRKMMQELTPLVEPLSIDEAFLDLKGTEKLHKAPPAFILARLVKRIENEIGVTVSVGLSYCKFLTKVASDLQKPRGFSLIGQAEAFDFLSKQPVTMIWGVGKAMAAKLASDGITEIRQLQKMDDMQLMKAYGVIGKRLFHFSRGEDSRSVSPDNEMKSVSAETTFDKDLHTLDDLVPVLRSLSEKVSDRLKRDDIAGNTVVLKLKSRDFKQRSRNQHLPDPTQIADRIFRVGLELLQKEIDGTPYRLLGIGVQQLVSDEQADPTDLVNEEATKRAAAETAMDKIRDKFGKSVIETGYTFKRGHHTRPQREK